MARSFNEALVNAGYKPETFNEVGNGYLLSDGGTGVGWWTVGRCQRAGTTGNLAIDEICVREYVDEIHNGKFHFRCEEKDLFEVVWSRSQPK